MRALLLILMTLTGAQTFALPLEIHSDSGIDGPAYEQIVKDLETLNMANPERTQLVNIGKTIRGRDTIGLMIYGDSHVQRTVTITGATHGNEYVGIVNRLAPELLNPKNTEFTSYFKSGGAVFILPILNPDGYEADRRANARGKDLNRDFPLMPRKMKGLSQPETENLVTYMEEWLLITGSTYEIAMDYHCCYGGLLYPFSYTDGRIPQQDLDDHIHLAEMMLDHFPKYKHGITGELLGYYPAGTSKDYWYLKYGARAYTFEGQYRTEVNKLPQHVSWWKQMLSAL